MLYDFRIFKDERLSEDLFPKVNDVINSIDKGFDNIDVVKLSIIDLDEYVKITMTKKDILITPDEEIHREWSMAGGKSFLVNLKKGSIVTPEKMIIGERSSQKDIYSFIINCSHIVRRKKKNVKIKV